MIPFSWREELSRRRIYSSKSRETFQVIGLVDRKEFSDPQYHWELFMFFCLSSNDSYVLAKEMHQFPESGWGSEPCSKETFFSCDLIDLTEEEAEQVRLILKMEYEQREFQKPPLVLWTQQDC